MISFWSRLLDLVSPRTCVVCGERLSVQEEVICLPCNLELPRTNCTEDFLDNDVARTFWGRIPIERAASLFYYAPQSRVSHLIYQLKYHHHPEVGTTLGRLFACELIPELFFEGIDAIVPVPLTKKRQRQRGYNQSAVIAQAIGEQTHLPVITNAMERLTFQQSQTLKHRWERNENVEHVFELVDDNISDQHLLLIDDVVTTGATVIACAKEMQKASNVKISVLALGFAKS